MQEDQMFDCPACGGTGLLADDEEWQYTCSICGGDGIVSKTEMATRKPRRIEVDEMNRVIE